MSDNDAKTYALDILNAAGITLRVFEAISGSRLSAPGESQDSWVWLLFYPGSTVSPDTRSPA